MSRRHKQAKSSRRNGSRKKLVKSGYTMYPPTIRMPLTRKLTFQFRNSFTGVSNGSGIFAGVIPCDPSATLSSAYASVALFPEYTNLVAVFGQVRCKQLAITLMPSTTDEVKGDIAAVITIGGNLQTIATPSNGNQVADNSDSQQWVPLLDQTGLGRYHALNHDLKRLTFHSSASPGNTTDYTGCPGGIGMYGIGFPVSTTIVNILAVGTYEFMTRT